MMQANTLTVLEAGRLAGRSKSHIFRAIKSGTLSAERDESGNYRIDPAELARVFPLARPSAPDDLTRNGHDTGLAQLEARVADAQDQIGDLRRRLDNSEEERRALNARLLTDQRPVRQWWRWRS